MSRVAKNPISVPKGVEIKLDNNHIKVKGPKGESELQAHELVTVAANEDVLNIGVAEESKAAWSQAGTARALINNMVLGVNNGWERKLELNGVGYRAQAQGKVLNLTLGFSHPVVFDVPEGITITTPSQTEIVVAGTDKQLVGQAAANIRAFRPPEPYKGKGVRYADEYVRRKEAKKK